MNENNAKYILISLYSNSQFFRGLLQGRGAWSLGLPEKGTEERQNLIRLLKEVTESLEKEDDKE